MLPPHVLNTRTRGYHWPLFTSRHDPRQEPYGLLSLRRSHLEIGRGFPGNKHLDAIALARQRDVGQVAALFDLGGLARISTTLHDAVQFTAGNWGKATNAVKIVQIYRTAGPAAALAQLAALAVPAAPKDGAKDGDGSVPPGAAPAALLLALVLTGAVVACAPLTARIDSLTGTSLADRCTPYRAGDVTASVLAASFLELAGLAAVDEAAVKALCATPAGALQVPKP